MNRPLRISVLALVASLAIAGTTLAVHAPLVGPVLNDIGRGTLATRVHYNRGGIKVETKRPVDIVVQELTFAKATATTPGASAGWHSHPGPVFVVIRSGTLSVWDKHCVKKTYSKGQSFFEAGPKSSLLVKNESTTEDATVYGTFIVPVGTTPLRIGKAHRCGVTE